MCIYWNVVLCKLDTYTFWNMRWTFNRVKNDFIPWLKVLRWYCCFIICVIVRTYLSSSLICKVYAHMLKSPITHRQPSPLQLNCVYPANKPSKIRSHYYVFVVLRCGVRMYAFVSVAISLDRRNFLCMVKKMGRIKVSSIIRKHSFQYVNQSLSIRIAFVN